MYANAERIERSAVDVSGSQGCLCFADALDAAGGCASANGATGRLDAVYSGPSATVSSYAFVDASQLGTTDICQAINTALTNFQLISFGLVVDARGMNPTGTVNCGQNLARLFEENPI